MIDGNNLAIRSAFANENLRNSENIPTGVHFGFFQSLINLKKSYPNYQFLICWDGKSKRRMIESESAVKNGLIKSAYKENRKKKDQPQPILDFYKQAPYLQKGIAQTGIPQIRLDEFETDDVIASYCKKLSGDEIIAVTSDADYYQILTDNVSVFDGMKQQLHTRQSFMDEYKIEPYQHVDVGALMGDDGDNIFGVPGIGDKTAIKEIKKYGTWQKVLDAYKTKFSDARKSFPDLKDPLLIKDGYDPKQVFEDMKNKKSEKGKFIYPEINFNMPYTGVLSAFDKETLKVKASKTEIMALMFEERIRLAYSLKKMDEDIPNLPEINKLPFNKDRVLEYFKYYDINTLDESIYLFE